MAYAVFFSAGGTIVVCFGEAGRKCLLMDEMKSYSLSQEQTALKSMDVRLISKLRAVLALAMLIVIYLDPSEPQYYAELTYLTLILYSVYALTLLIFSYKHTEFVPVRYAHWIDVTWCLVLIALSSGSNSVFFFLFFFAIHVASFRFGFREGFKITAASVVSFVLIGISTAAAGAEIELNRFLLRPVYLGILGYMLSYWGGQELQLRERLQVIKDINNLYNPRFGIDLTVAAVLQKIQTSFDADGCVLISHDPNTAAYSLRQFERANPEQAIYAEPVAADHPLLLRLPASAAAAYNGGRRRYFSKKPSEYLVLDLSSGRRTAEAPRSGEIIADLLDTNSFISVPFYRRETFSGRLYLTSQTKCFDYSEMDFLRQILNHAVPVIENVRLLDSLASEATEQQRLKISRDLHDSTVQPYIGLKFGLEALQIKRAAGQEIDEDIERLVEMASTNIVSIRGYINKLKDDESDSESGAVLVSAIRQQARKISEFYGIEIEVFAADEIHINDRLSAEIFQIVTEGLSNIKRHTKASAASIIIGCEDKTLTLEIANNNPDSERAAEFVPKSIAGRAESLGGRIFVETKADRTKISVEIPL